MTTPPNRGPKGPQSNPTPAEVRAARELTGLTQTAAASLVYSTCRAWQKWESGEARMHPAMFELFALKMGLKKLQVPAKVG